MTTFASSTISAQAADSAFVLDNSKCSVKQEKCNKPLLSEQPLTSSVVLVVDDNLMLTKILQAHFEHDEIECKVFNNPKNALQWYEKYYAQVGLIFMDIEMPYLNGPECFEKMQRINSEAKAAFMSGNPTSPLAQKVRNRKGVLSMMWKPFSFVDAVDWAREIMNSTENTGGSSLAA